MKTIFLIIIVIFLIKILKHFFKKQFNTSWLVNKIMSEQFYKKSKKYLKGNLIDIGCGDKPYKNFLKTCVKTHIGLDHNETFHSHDNIDLYGTAYNIPSDDASFDSAICTAVLEHLEEPELALQECYRILKKNSYVIYTVPFIWHLHEEPRDFYRYSKYGLRYLFEKTGFEIVELNALSGFWVTFGQLLVYKISTYNNKILKAISIIPLLGFIIQRVCFLIHKFDKDKRWTWMYLIVAKK
tara:strand:- start:2258 stop:2977 length:720 start_codon:yes stop_codon:yes gene_type:complete